MSAKRRNQRKSINPQTPRRQSILDRIERGESNNTISVGLGLSFDTVREHIKVLRRAGVVVDAKRGGRKVSKLRNRSMVPV